MKGIGPATIEKLRWLRAEGCAGYDEWFARHGTHGNRLPALIFTFKLVESEKACPLPRGDDEDCDGTIFFRLTERGRELLRELDDEGGRV